jgi:hypothetical protein
VNYDQRIEILLQKGIFSEEQAQKLSATLNPQGDKSALNEEKRWSLDFIGFILFVSILLYIFFSFVASPASQHVEDISKSFNNTSVSGIGADSTLLFISLFIIVLLYTFLYFLAHQRYNKVLKLLKQKNLLQQKLHYKEVIKKELNEKLEQDYVRSVYYGIEDEIYKIKSELAEVEGLCHSYLKTFPNSLALLVAKLPQCH